MKLEEDILDVQVTLASLDYESIGEAVKILKRAKNHRDFVFTFGNGGSHSNASHFANDLLKACNIRAICISDMIPTILAYMNDESTNHMFSEPIRWLFEPDCVGIGFSCSGNSVNIVEALANLQGIPHADRILFTGDNGGVAKSCANVVIKVPNPNIRIQESCHSVICHAIIEALLDE